MKEYKKTISGFRLVKEPTAIQAAKIVRSEDLHQFIKPFFASNLEIFEAFWLLTLNRSNTVTGAVMISQGGTVGTVIDVKLIAKYAIEALSSSIVLAHNHPSGNIQPSGPDKEITRKIKETMKLFDISILDHIILGGEKYYSFADECDL